MLQSTTLTDLSVSASAAPMEDETEYSVVVIGAGSAGITAADFAVKLGAKTALIEAERIGGDCTWTGCVPSKALIKCAKVAQTARKAQEYGIEGVNAPAVRADMSQVRQYVQRAIHKVYQEETPEKLRERGIDVFIGWASFLDERRIEIRPKHGASESPRILRANRFVVCTGAKPRIPESVQKSNVKYLTYETIFDLQELPDSLLVVGAGPIGTEMAQAFARLGSNVTLLGKPLPKEDEDTRNCMLKVLEDDGISVIVDRLDALHQQDSGLITATTTASTQLSATHVLIATGRMPNLESLNLDKAGVEWSPFGIRTDSHLKAKGNDRVFAAGDCAGSPQFTHYAGFQAFMAVRNFTLPGRDRGFSEVLPRCTFTDPEVAAVGMSEEEFVTRYHDKGHIFKVPINKVDRAVCENEEDGFIKIMYTKDKHMHGAVIVCQRAGELINEISLAMQQGMKVTDIGRAIHAYPTFGFALQQLSAELAVESLFHGWTGKLVSWFRRV